MFTLFRREHDRKKNKEWTSDEMISDEGKHDDVARFIEVFNYHAWLLSILCTRFIMQISIYHMIIWETLSECMNVCIWPRLSILYAVRLGKNLIIIIVGDIFGIANIVKMIESRHICTKKLFAFIYLFALSHTQTMVIVLLLSWF